MHATTDADAVEFILMHCLGFMMMMITVRLLVLLGRCTVVGFSVHIGWLVGWKKVAVDRVF